MTDDQSKKAQRVAEERYALKLAMNRLPFDINKAGHVRVSSLKAAIAHAQKVLTRNGMDPSPYAEARRNIEFCGSGKDDELAKQTWELTNGKKAEVR